MRSQTQHSPLHGGTDFFGEKQSNDRELKSSNSSHLCSLGSDCDSDAEVWDSDYPEFNKLTNIERTIKLLVRIKFSNCR